jgi:hypothetical protein
VRTAPFLLLLPLAACGDAGDETIAADRAADRERRVECALDAAPAFERICLLERASGEEGLTLTIRSPDGSFRRLLVTNDGRGVIAADGAEPAVVAIVADSRIEVAIGDDRYRLPATVQAKR